MYIVQKVTRRVGSPIPTPTPKAILLLLSSLSTLDAEDAVGVVVAGCVLLDAAGVDCTSFQHPIQICRTTGFVSLRESLAQMKNNSLSLQHNLKFPA